MAAASPANGSTSQAARLRRSIAAPNPSPTSAPNTPWESPASALPMIARPGLWSSGMMVECEEASCWARISPVL